MTYSYCVSGLSVSSEVDLPGLIADPVSGRLPDVTIRRQRVPQALDGVAASRGPTWEIAGDRFLLRITGVARFLLTGGHDIAFELEEDATEDDVAIFLIGTVFGILLHQRQHVVLHASAVRVGGKAVLFCGPSGAGKSTIAAALGQRGLSAFERRRLRHRGSAQRCTDGVFRWAQAQAMGAFHRKARSRRAPGRNTWLRMLIANLSAKDGKPVDINDLPERGGIASARGPFDYLLLIDSDLLTHDEADCLRPRVYEELASGALDDEYDTLQDAPPVRFVKVQDAYTLTPNGEPLLAGARGADGAIVIVRDPRDVAPSLANHNRSSIDQAINFMNDKSAGFSASATTPELQRWLPSCK
jgi:hypothetical protein